MIALTQQELNILRKFSDGKVAKGESDPTVDMLACRGLLVRQERVDRPLSEFTATVPGGYAAELRRRLTERASNHSYQISKRGRRALAHHIISSF